MARFVVLGAGVAGHTAAMMLRRGLPRRHEVVVIAPNAHYQWIPSNIWVGVGRMTPKQVQFPLAPVYRRKGILFHQALATALHPEGSGETNRPCVDFSYTNDSQSGTAARLENDFLVNATGPKLNFAATEGLDPEGHMAFVCEGRDTTANLFVPNGLMKVDGDYSGKAYD